MHVPSYFKNEDLKEVKEFLRENAFGILLSQQDFKIVGTHIPLELEQDESGADVLLGHISKANEQRFSLKDNIEVLVIFNGPHGYISSSLYEKENVSTWNYIAVHVYGTITIQNEQQLLESLKKLTNKYEAHSKNPVSVESLSKQTMKQINGIIGISISINEIQAAYKLSQNRNDHDYHHIVESLESSNSKMDVLLAEKMKGKR